MIIIGCDYHPGFQQIAFVDTETGDCGEQRLEHSEAAEKFYRDLAAQGIQVRVAMEASGQAQIMLTPTRKSHNGSCTATALRRSGTLCTRGLAQRTLRSLIRKRMASVFCIHRRILLTIGTKAFRNGFMRCVITSCEAL